VLALKMLLQVAAQDIGQLTDIEPPCVFPRVTPYPGCLTLGRATILRRLAGLYM